MRTLGYLLLACMVLAAIKAALSALLVVLAIGLVWLAATRPREMTGLIGLLILSGLIHNHGLATLGAACFLAVIGLIGKRGGGEAPAMLRRLPPPPPHHRGSE